MWVHDWMSTQVYNIHYLDRQGWVNKAVDEYCTHSVLYTYYVNLRFRVCWERTKIPKDAYTWKWGIYIGLYNIIGLVYRESSVPETYFARTSFKFKPLRTDARQLIYFPKE